MRKYVFITVINNLLFEMIEYDLHISSLYIEFN
jgi:hypothetical protein